MAADAVLLLHVLFVLFVVLGLLLIFAGRFLSWSWVRNPWFRVVHLAAVALVVLQSWLGIICPLTNWEMTLRSRAGDAVYGGSFIAHWLGELLYYQAPPWVFAVSYSLFGLLVLLSWFRVPPRPFGRRTP
jgi:drug/metabolite transporter superfamily protein YnfA